jgi:hypothetical protein
VEDHETLKPSAVISKLSDTVKAKINDLLTNGVVTTGIVVSGIFLAGDELLRVVKLSVGTGTNLVNHTRLKIKVYGTWDVLSGTGLREEGVEGVIATSDGLVGRHLAIRLDAVLEAVKLPAGVASLDTALANVDVDNLTHD